VASLPMADVPENCMLMWRWSVDGAAAQRNHLVPDTYKALAFKKPQIKTTVATEGDKLVIVITAQAPAFYVMLETSVHGWFSDNAFDVLPGESVTVRFTPDDRSQLELVRADIVVRDVHSATYAA
jgi:beta-mannosidase